MGPRIPPVAQALRAAPNSHRALAVCENTNKFGLKHAFFWFKSDVERNRMELNRYSSFSSSYHYCGRPGEPAILISRLLLRMRRMYVVSIRLTSIKNE